MGRMQGYVSTKFSYIYFRAAMLILLMHTGGLQSSWTYAHDFSWGLVTVLVRMGVPALAWFFFSSAYFLFRGYDGDYIGMIKKKVKSLGIPYLVWNTIAYFYYRVFYDSIVIGEINIDLKGFLQAYFNLFIPPNTVYRSANAALWTVAMLFCMAIISPILKNIFCKKYSFLLIIFAETIVIGLNVNVSSTFYWLPIYCLGAYVAMNFSTELEDFLDYQVSLKKDMLHIILTIGIYIGMVVLSLRGGISQTVLRFLAPFMGILCLRYLPIPRKTNYNIQNISFFIYVVHGMLLDVYIPIIYRCIGNSIPIICTFLLIFCWVCVSIVALWILMKRVFPVGLQKIFMGGRVY